MKMLARFAPVFLIALILAPVSARSEEEGKPKGLVIGDAAPLATVEMKNVDGKNITIAEVAGKKGTLVIFTCNSCPWVKAWEDRIAEIGNTYAQRGVGVIAINPNDPSQKSEDDYPEMKKRAKKLGLRFAYVTDGSSDVARAFGATRTPEVFLFDAEGRLVYHGAIDDNARDSKKVEKPYLRQALDAMLSGQEIPLQETKAFGCMIKFRPEA